VARWEVVEPIPPWKASLIRCAYPPSIAMWLRTIFRRRSRAPEQAKQTALNETLLRRLERLTLATARGLPGGLSGEHPSRRRLPAPTVSDHRPYSAGDDLRYVDWHAYARLDHLHLKLGEAEQDVRVSLLIDCSASMDWGEGDLNKLHYARLLAATIGYLALASGDHLQVLPFGSTTPAPGMGQWGPASGRTRAVDLLQFIQQLAPGGDEPAVRVIERLARRPMGMRQGLLVVVSDLLHNDEWQAALATFTPPRWQILMLHLLHPGELRPELQGDVELLDSETGAQLTAELNTAAIDRYSAEVERWCDQLAKRFAKRGIHYARLTTDLPLERGAIPYLRTREVLR
jgi:uncharacterized protein (DUF58 family)